MAPVPPWSVLLLAIGVPFVLWPYQVARAYEIVDAIGRRSAGPVEPADWYVTLTRVGGIVFVVVGVAGVLGAFR